MLRFQKKKRLHRHIKRFHSFSGCISVMRKQRVLFQQGYGYADEKKQLHHTLHTTYRIGSLTKQFTAFAILLLQCQGRLDIHHPVQHYFPDYPNGGEITLHHLLSMSSGVPNYLNDLLFAHYNLKAGTYQPGISKDFAFSPEDLIACFQHKPLKFTPGTAYDYSNSNYILLGCIIELVSGQSYASFLQKYIFTPLGMSQSDYWSGPSNPTNSIGYDTLAPRPVPVFSFHNSLMFAAGGISSSVHDLQLWLRSLQNASLLNDSELQKLFIPYANMYGSSYSYAYGWIVDQTASVPIAEHTGTAPGYSSYMYFDDSSKISIIICSNSWGEGAIFPKMYQGIVDIVRD